MNNIYILTSGYKGGITTFVKQQIKYLKSNKNSINIIDNNPFVTFKDIPKKKLNLYSIGTNKNYISTYRKLNSIFLKKNNPGYVLITNYAIFVKFFFLFISLKKKNFKIILFIHSGLLNFTFKSYLAAILFSFACVRVDKLIFGSLSAKKWWHSKFPWFFKKSVIIYNGIKIQKKNYFKANYNLNSLNVSFVGRVELENNPYLFVDVARDSLRRGFNFKFNMFGDGNLLNDIRKYKFINFYGWQPLNKIIRNTDILLILSKVNNFPYAALEAKSFGIPVISCSEGDISRIIRNNQDGFLLKDSNINVIINHLLKVSNRYKYFRKSSLKNVKNFNVNLACTKLWSYINKN